MNKKTLDEIDKMVAAVRGEIPLEDWMLEKTETGEPRIKFIQDMERESPAASDDCPGPGWYRHPDTGVWMHTKTARIIDMQLYKRGTR